MTSSPSDPFAHEYDTGAAETIRPQGHDFEMVVTPRYRTHLVDQRYEPLSADLVRAAAPRHDVFLDVGAHYGFFSLVAATRNPKIEVLACEPIPETLVVLRRSFALNGLAADRAMCVAVSDRTGRAEIQVALASDNSSFYPHPNAPPLGSLEVDTATVDSLLSGRSIGSLFVKVDTDGHELAVLAGMEETLRRVDEVTLLVELNPKMQRAAGRDPEELPAALDALGFECYLLDEDARRPCRLRQPADWHRLIPDDTRYANLWCVRRERSLSVAFVSHSAGLAGAERSLLELVTELVADQGAVCTVVLPEVGPLGPRIEDVGGAVVVAELPWWCETLTDGDDPGAPDPTAAAAQLTERLAAASVCLFDEPLADLARIDPHVVVTNTLAIPWGSWLAPALRRPHVWHVCEYDDEESGFRFPLGRDEMRETIVASSHLVLTANHELARIYAEAGADTRPLYRHLDVPPGPHPPSGLYRRPGATRLVTVATLWRPKGQDLVVEAVGRLVAAGLDLELLFVGPPQQPFGGAVQALAEARGLAGRVHFAGGIENAHAAMAEADVVVVGSRSEAFCRTAVEAMLLEKTVVYPRIGGPAEYMRDGETGLGYRAGDVEALAVAIERLAGDPALRRRLGEAARRDATATFTRERYGGVAAELLRRLRGEAPRLAPLWAGLLPAIADAARRQGLEAGSAESTALRARALAAEQERDALAAELGALRQTSEELAEAVERLRTDADELRNEREELKSLSAGLQGQSVELRAEAARSREELAAVYGSRTWRTGRLLRLPLDLLRTAAARLGHRRR